MARRDGQTFFYLHVMKTAGSTMVEHLRHNFRPDEMYPRPDGSNGSGAYFHIDKLEALTTEERLRVRLIRGHFPFMVAASIGPPDRIIITVLRDPVARTISLLAYEQSLKQPDRTLEEIYSDSIFFKRFVQNHQTKVFSLVPEDQPLSVFKPIAVTEERLALAKENLNRVDVVGFQDRFDDLLLGLHDRFGWQFDSIEDQNVGLRSEVSPEFRRQIESDNAIDMEFYRYAQELHSPSGGRLSDRRA